MKFKATTNTIHETQYLHSGHTSDKLQCTCDLQISRGKKLQFVTTAAATKQQQQQDCDMATTTKHYHQH